MGQEGRMMRGDCLCKGLPGVTYLAIRGASVGLLGLAEPLRLWREAGVSPDHLTDQEILRAIRAHNYVPEPVEADYVVAVRTLYAARR